MKARLFGFLITMIIVTDDTPYTVAEVRNDPAAKNYDWSLAELLDTKVTVDEYGDSDAEITLNSKKYRLKKTVPVKIRISK